MKKVFYPKNTIDTTKTKETKKNKKKTSKNKKEKEKEQNIQNNKKEEINLKDVNYEIHKVRRIQMKKFN